MKNGTLYARRVKKLLSRLKNTYGRPQIPEEPTNPVDQLILGLLSVETSDAKARRAVTALREAMVDINEVRVSTSAEVAAAIATHVPESIHCADAIRASLNAIFRREHGVTLDHLQKTGLREAKQYLEHLDGVDPGAAASVLLWSLGGHAIPVDRRMHEALRRENCVEPSASRGEVQAFLERNISASDAKMFCLLMNRFSSATAPRPHVSAPSKSRSAGAGKAKTAAGPSAKKRKNKTTSRKTTSKTRKRASSR
ncbi:MAG: hypothetical protein V3W34_18195 [Phycisphaerae bacterium]